MNRRFGVRALLCAALGVPMMLWAAAQAAQAQPQLNAITTQALPNGHVRVILQFNSGIGVFVRTGSAAPTTNFTLQVPNAAAAPTVQSVYAVNQGAVQTITVGQVGAVLTVAIALTSPLLPRVSPVAANGSVLIDVPRGAPGAVAPNPFAPVPGAGPYAPPTPPPAGEMTKIIRLRYADVSEVVGILTSTGGVAPSNIFNPQPSQLGSQAGGAFGQFGQQGFPTTTFPQQTFGTSTFPAYQQPFGVPGAEAGTTLGQRINDNLAIDRRLNAVILTGTPDQIAKAEELIAMIDVPVPSVLLDTEVLEVTESGAKALGLDYNQSPTTPITRVFNAQAATISGLPAGAVPGALEFQTNIFLLVSKGAARVLASPKILTEDGVSASILTGDSLPIRVTTPVGVGGVGAVSSQVQYVNVGVNLQILPHVTAMHAVEANIFSQVSSVTGFTSSNDPQISTRQAQTKVNLTEGETLVIGGLLQQRDIRNLQKIPILGDIPLVGALFRFYTQTRQNTNLVITITPHIIPAPQVEAPATAAPAVPAIPTTTPTYPGR